VWTDSESDDPEDWVELTTCGSLQSKAFQEQIKKKAAFARLNKRMIAKEVTKKALLKERSQNP
jgi:hypothetical protein